MKFIHIPHLAPSKKGEGVDTVTEADYALLGDACDYDNTLLGGEYTAMAIDLDRNYDDAIQGEEEEWIANRT